MKTQIQARLDEVLAIAREKYGFEQPVEVLYNLRGLTRGQAISRREGGYTLRFNLAAFALDAVDSIANNVPHEVAHLVVSWQYFRDLPRKRPMAHGREWRRVCLALGGNGAPRHCLDTSRVRPKTVHIYTLQRAGAIAVGPKVHKAIQAGRVYRVRQTREPITAASYTGLQRVCVKASDR